MPQSIIQRSFATGELAPGLGARADLALYLSALRTCRNFTVRRHGGVANRPGTVTIAETKASGSAKAVLRPFVFAAASASFAVECGDNYFRFYKNGAVVKVSGLAAYNGATAYVPGDLVVSGGVNYYCIANTTGNAPPNATYWYAMPGDNTLEIPTPYPSGAFLTPDPACWSQNGLTVTISHLNYAPRELTYASDTRWTLTTIVTGPSIAAPGGTGGTPGAAGTRTYKYVVTARASESYEEGHPSAVVTIGSAAAPTKDAPNSITWAAVTGAAQYDVYGDGAEGNGSYGYIGTTIGATAFKDVGTAPDFGRTPPIARPLFDGTNKYPAANVAYQQRRIFAGTHTDRELVYASQVGFYKNFERRVPLQDDDAVTFKLASDYIQPVHFLISLKVGLIVLTDSGEWVIQGDDAGVLRPTAINPRQHGYVGAAQVKPVVVGENVVFVQGRGTVLRDLRFDVKVEGLSGRDLTLRSAHLFEGYSIVDMAYAQVPDSTIWCVRSDGALLGLTYIKDEDMWGWHRHDTVDGSFESVCVLPEGNEDAVYVVVKRTYGSATKRYVERFATRRVTAIADGVFVDAAKVYSGTATTVLSGLGQLQSKPVAVLADGVVVTGLTVSAGGGLTLPAPASKITVGLPITAELETLDLDVQGSALRDAKKRVQSLALLLENSARGFKVGPDAAHLLTHSAAAWEASGLTTGQVEMNLTSGFNNQGRTLIRHTDPTPLTVLGVIPHVEVGG